MTQAQFWNTRYENAGEDYVFGTEPNRFLAHRAPLLASGSTAIAIADGEGRNSVWLAAQGLKVTAVEFAPAALRKARKLAAGRGVQVDFIEADILAADWPPADMCAAFDWVVAIFVQFTNPQERERQFAAMKALTKPGGRILLQGYTPKQLDYKTGGPSAVENLYTPALLQELFADWQIEELVEYEDEIDEGPGHKGKSALIGLVARKPDD